LSFFLLYPANLDSNTEKSHFNFNCFQSPTFLYSPSKHAKPSKMQAPQALQTETTRVDGPDAVKLAFLSLFRARGAVKPTSGIGTSEDPTSMSGGNDKE
jgi:hypothetical protein